MVFGVFIGGDDGDVLLGNLLCDIVFCILDVCVCDGLMLLWVVEVVEILCCIGLL